MCGSTTINGSSFLAIKVAIDAIPHLLSAGLRFSITGAALFTIYFIQINKPIFKNNTNIDNHKDTESHNLISIPKKKRIRLKSISQLNSGNIALILGVTVPWWSGISNLGCTIPFIKYNWTLKFNHSIMGCNYWIFIV